MNPSELYELSMTTSFETQGWSVEDVAEMMEAAARRGEFHVDVDTYDTRDSTIDSVTRYYEYKGFDVYRVNVDGCFLRISWYNEPKN